MLGGGLLIAFLVVRALRAARGGPKTVAEPESLGQRLADLRSSSTSDPSPRAVVDRTYALSALVRESLGGLGGTAEPGATDAEWLASLGNRGLTPEELAELERTFERFGRIKYAGELPSAWASDELFEATERWIARGEQLADANSEDPRSLKPAASGGAR